MPRFNLHIGETVPGAPKPKVHVRPTGTMRGITEGIGGATGLLVDTYVPPGDEGFFTNFFSDFFDTSGGEGGEFTIEYGDSPATVSIGDSVIMDVTEANGSDPVTYEVLSGTLPPGLSLTASGGNAGRISGTPGAF